MISKYDRTIQDKENDNVWATVDVYSVLVAFNVVNPGLQHAIKKLLCAGLRGKNDTVSDLRESIEAIRRAIKIEQQKQKGETQ